MIDGKAEALWGKAEWSEMFVDIEGVDHEKPYWGTRFKMLWSKAHLYIFAQMEEPHVWANLTRRDAIVYRDNDFEVFVKPDAAGDEYFEFELNARNTVLDLLMTKPYRNGGKALIQWDATEVESAVDIQGTINEPGDVDSGWSLEMKIPYTDLAFYGKPIVPVEGRFWRINFSRVQWEHQVLNGAYFRKRKNNGSLVPENNWVWSPQGIVDMHYPEQWGYLFFTKEAKDYSIAIKEWQKFEVWDLYYELMKYYNRKRTYEGFNVAGAIDDSWTWEDYMDSDLFYVKLYPSEGNYYFVLDHKGNLQTKYYE
ncbi:carbohydrate-binding family 9-like protein [Membranihabitans maritimus]|uniref:carbohydrate-binding family 9-like protein n=1 Tax=Membranihabitans maritimus TaxID=2904244 RepID=UPI001F419C68